jgi:peptidoglycan/LPS O-acetylase OafA/YrhL
MQGAVGINGYLVVLFFKSWLPLSKKMRRNHTTRLGFPTFGADLQPKDVDNNQFYNQFAGIFAISALFLLVVGFVPSLSTHAILGWSLLTFFSLFVLLAFMLGKRAAGSDNKNDFIRLIILLIFAKMVACLLIVVIYDSTNPPDTNYLVHFLTLYLIYSIFEYRILSKLGYQK